MVNNNNTVTSKAYCLRNLRYSTADAVNTLLCKSLRDNAAWFEDYQINNEDASQAAQWQLVATVTHTEDDEQDMSRATYFQGYKILRILQKLF